MYLKRVNSYLINLSDRKTQVYYFQFTRFLMSLLSRSTPKSLIPAAREREKESRANSRRMGERDVEAPGRRVASHRACERTLIIISH